jgi:hypothetical protein
MVWTQALHMRDPQLGRAPPDLATELERLLRRMNISRAPDALSLHSETSLTSHWSSSMVKDVQYKDSVRIHQLIMQIRAIPGHEGFMRGLPFEELAQCASRHSIAMLVAAAGECHALILQPNKNGLLTLRLSGITPDELATMSIAASVPQKRGCTLGDVHDDRRGMKVSVPKMYPKPVLAKLWTTVVKPIIECLRLQVCRGNASPSITPV